MILSISRFIAKVLYGREDTAMTTIIWERKDRQPYKCWKAVIEFFDPDHFDVFK